MINYVRNYSTYSTSSEFFQHFAVFVYINSFIHIWLIDVLSHSKLTIFSNIPPSINERCVLPQLIEDFQQHRPHVCVNTIQISATQKRSCRWSPRRAASGYKSWSQSRNRPISPAFPGLAWIPRYVMAGDLVLLTFESQIFILAEEKDEMLPTTKKWN